ncbi:hypothetical protein M5K25_003692 [Dendrobium thyrsiflorum]|uniref:Uncharacterized protein n=1 Tax=Dendrobium thyrsiflorum TaxID=117978 RepID=A0ABD0VJX0_DENTH
MVGNYSTSLGEVIPPRVHNVGEIKTLYVPPLSNGTRPGSLFYKVGERKEENYDWFVEPIDSEETMPVRIPSPRLSLANSLHLLAGMSVGASESPSTTESTGADIESILVAESFITDEFRLVIWLLSP